MIQLRAATRLARLAVTGGRGTEGGLCQPSTHFARRASREQTSERHAPYLPPTKRSREAPGLVPRPPRARHRLLYASLSPSFRD
jgi:hypothetical protein